MSLSPYEMNSVLIAGPNKLQEKVIKEFHKLKILHIVDHSKSEMADIGSPLENANKLSELIVKIRALITALNIKKEDIKFELKRDLLEVESTTKKLSEEANKNLEELKIIEDKLSKNQNTKQELEILKDINVPLENFTSYKSLTYFTGYLEEKNNLSYLKEKLSQITEKFVLFHNVIEKKTFIALFVDIGSKENVNNILRKSNLSHPRLKVMLSTLIGKELINKIEYDGKNTFVITEKGRLYLAEYKRFSDLASSFGLGI